MEGKLLKVENGSIGFAPSKQEIATMQLINKDPEKRYMDETQEQPNKQPADHLKPWQFKPGVSGNPGGRPKGSKSLKTFAREYLESLSDEEKLEFLKGMDKIVTGKHQV